MVEIEAVELINRSLTGETFHCVPGARSRYGRRWARHSFGDAIRVRRSIWSTNCDWERGDHDYGRGLAGGKLWRTYFISRAETRLAPIGKVLV